MNGDKPLAGIKADRFQVLTEREINNVIEIGVIYRPATYSLLLIREGSIHFRYNLAEYKLNRKTLLLVLPNSVYEFNEISPNAKLISTTIDREFLEQSRSIWAAPI